MKRIKKVQTKDYIADILKDYIILGKFAPGQEIYQEELTEVLGLSRTPIREALQSLEQDGFLERMPNRHMRVIPLTKDNIFMNFKLVGKLITETANIIIENNIDIRKLTNVYNEYELAVEKGDKELADEKELEFLYKIPEITSNQYIIQICSKLLRGFPNFAILKVDSVIGENKELIDNIYININIKDHESMNSAADKYFENMAIKVAKILNQ